VSVRLSLRDWGFVLNALGQRAVTADQAAESGEGRSEFTSPEQWHKALHYLAGEMRRVYTEIDTQALEPLRRGRNASATTRDRSGVEGAR
jgi:hypothetical protein